MLNALCAIRIGKEITNPNSTTFNVAEIEGLSIPLKRWFPLWSVSVK
jgi:hypothetical protein